MSTSSRNWTAGFYWIGAIMTVACFALVLAGNTELLWRFEHRGFPLSWAFAGIAVLAFLAAELGERSLPTPAEERTSESPAELETAEV